MKFCGWFVLLITLSVNAKYLLTESLEHNSSEKKELEDLFDIEGEVYYPEYISASAANKERWLLNTKVYTKGGQYVAFLRKNGKFTLRGVPSGSYIVEVLSPSYVYEPVRVEINSKGKFRARKLNYIQNSQVTSVPYPLKFKSFGLARYFQPREQWRITDVIFNPMVLMMLVPVLCIMVLPKVINDQDAKKEMEQIQNMAKYDMPEVSEMITSFFSRGDTNKQDSQSSSSSGRRNSAIAARATRKYKNN